MRDFEVRMLDEYRQLMHRLDALHDALEDDGREMDASPYHLSLMTAQYDAMHAYAQILSLRMESLGIDGYLQ